jgi:ATP-dependent Clp protease ATP-binding subunit ClpB
VVLRLNNVAERLKDRRITLDVDEATREWLVKKGYLEVYGARAITLVVHTEMLFLLA